MNFFKKHFSRHKGKYINSSIFIFTTVITLELGSFLTLQILKKDGVNLFIDTAKCPYFQRLMPHPYLGYVYGPRETCEDSIEVTNKLGFLGEELPPKRSNENFYVMLVGGSVAQQLGNMSIKEQNGGLLSYSFLGEHLNKCYLPPKPYKEFKLSVVAMGGWTQPQNAISTLLFGERAHAIVNLDGFNEHYAFKNPYAALGLPSNNFSYLMKLKYTGNPLLGFLISLVSDITLLQYNNPLLKYSNTLNLIRKTANRISVIFNPNKNYWREIFKGDRKISYYGQFALPKTWDSEMIADYNFTQYKKYLEITSQIGKVNKTKTAFFLQPVPALHKELTEYEKLVPIDYEKAYVKLEKEFLSLKEKGLEVHSLTKIYKDIKDNVYGDDIHASYYQKSPNKYESIGYEIMAKSITEIIAEKWGFTKISRSNMCH